MRFIMRVLYPLLTLPLLLSGTLASTQVLATSTFSAAYAIVMPAGGAAAPHPSNIYVNGVLGVVTKVTVRLLGIEHQNVNDLYVTLEGPGGDTLVLMADVGGSTDITAVDLTFDDAAAGSLPPKPTTITSGIYKPTVLGPPSVSCLPLPAGTPAPTATMLSVFNGKDPNGVWRLYVCDEFTSDPGMIVDGWSISFEGATATMLESPTPTSVESGIGLIRGWVCEAGRIDVLIDGSTSLQLPYGTSRPDTDAVCDDVNNGFGGVVNWNRMGDGLHEIRAFADGVEFTSATFTVTTLGEEYLTGVAGEFFQADFPDPGRDLTLRWSEPHQNFVFVGTTTSPGNPTDTRGDGVTAWLESPFPGSSESGIGLIRGWACSASSIAVMIDADPVIQTSYGAERLDTQSVCGDANNGFGVVVNWNRYASGAHRLRAFADGSPTPFADVSFNVFNIGVEYLSCVPSTSRDLADFPAAVSTTTVNWSTPHQGAVITGYTP